MIEETDRRSGPRLAFDAPSHALRPLIPDIQAALRDLHASIDLAPHWGHCLRSACSDFHILRGCGLSPLLALGRIWDDTPHDHAWIVCQINGRQRILDNAVNAVGLSYQPMAFLDSRRVWTAVSEADLAALNPQFFLTMHCQINSQALKGTFDASDIDDINHMNARVDDPFVHPNYDPREHFDNALIEESIALLEDRLGWAGETLLHTVAPGSPATTAYGLALHAIADFYSHSNFVPAALAFFGNPGDVVAFDLAIANEAFTDFMATSWQNSSMWREHEGYASVDPFPLQGVFAKCFFTGGYGGDGWVPRPDVPHHNDFAVDQPTSQLVNLPEIQRRKHPYAFPGEWLPQYSLRKRLAIEHIQRAAKRAKAGDPAPFLGAGLSIPAILRPPGWTMAFNLKTYPDRGSDGWLTPVTT